MFRKLRVPMPIVDANQLDYADNYDLMREVCYRGEPFTGTARTTNGTIDYVNGMAHGRYLYRFDNGIPSEEGLYAEGECIRSCSWYEDGTPQETHQAEGIQTSKWDRDGILAYQAGEDAAGNYQTRWFYKNGIVKQCTTNLGTDYFAPDGQLAMQVTYGQRQNGVKYVADVLKTSYLDVLSNYFTEASQEKSTAAWYFWGWVWMLLEKAENRPTAMAILHHLNAAGFSAAANTLKTISTVDLDTFRGAMSYRIEE